VWKQTVEGIASMHGSVSMHLTVICEMPELLRTPCSLVLASWYWKPESRWNWQLLLPHTIYRYIDTYIWNGI